MNAKEFFVTESKAMAACVALVEAFDAERSAGARRELMETALKLAMEATGHENAERASELVDNWSRDARSEKSVTNRSSNSSKVKSDRRRSRRAE